MISLWILPALTCFILLLWGEVALFFGLRRLVDLRKVPPLVEPPFPPVSVIVAARNEERHLEEALGTLLGLDYPAFDVIVVDDRSTDGTPAILERLGSKFPRLRALRVSELPEGWLGKCHALSQGAKVARGDYLLFTDADILFHPTALRKAMACLRREGLDHLAVVPGLRMPGALLGSIVATFGLFFMLFFRPWKAPNPRSRAHIGIGAFNLVRKELYEKIGGHESVRCCPVDDVKLGQRLKEAGGRQAAAIGVDLLSVEWYASVGELIRGLEKNAFAAFGYRLSWVALSTLVIAGLSAGPVVLAILAKGALSWVLGGGSILLLWAMYLDQVRIQRISLRSLALFPLALGILVYVQWRSAIKTLLRGGIEWRGTIYPLSELRKP